MSVNASALRKLAALNLTAEQMAGVLDILADQAQAEEERKEAQRERTRKHRAKRDGNVTGTLQPRYDPPKKEIPPTPPKEKTTPPPFSEATASSNGARASFAEFWTLFPNKIGKRDAEKAFATAIRRAPFEAIMAGLSRYVAKTDDRPWCNPTTFLNQDRWEDQPAATPPARSQAPPKRDTYVDAMHRILEGRANGTENIFGTDGDAQRISADGQRQGTNVADIRGGLARRIIQGSG